MEVEQQTVSDDVLVPIDFQSNVEAKYRGNGKSTVESIVEYKVESDFESNFECTLKIKTIENWR